MSVFVPGGAVEGLQLRCNDNDVAMRHEVWHEAWHTA
jgi:hypothetical protein